MNSFLLRVCSLLTFPSLCFAQISYDRHVVFDNSLPDRSFYYSRTYLVAPSEFDQVGSKLPVDDAQYFTPPNSLRLKWRSATGGDGALR